MPVHLVADSARSDSTRAPRALHIGLVNNMPDSALKATERQFFSLLEAGAGDTVVNLSLYALPEVPRSDTSKRHIRRFYSSVEALWDARLDGLILTGAEPRTASLRHEPYWNSMVRVLDWAEQNTHSAICSCLAAHAAVLHLDGIERRKFREKRFGVFQFDVADAHFLTAGIDSRIELPHSRWNDIAGQDLASHGYSILTKNADGGVDAFLRQRKSLFVFLQGHPEYEADTLLREYRRDIGRYLKRESDRYPAMPRDYFDSDARQLLASFENRVRSDRSGESAADFPTARLSKRVSAPWRAMATQLYRNWLAFLQRNQGLQQTAPRIGARGERGFSLSETAAFRSSFLKPARHDARLATGLLDRLGEPGIRAAARGVLPLER